MNITIFNEGRDEKIKPEIFDIYPNGIGGVLYDIVSEIPDANIIKIASLYEDQCGLTNEILDQTDVLIFWSHSAHKDFPDDVSNRIYTNVLNGMGFISLHSSMGSKPFKALMGTSCTMRYKHDDFERVFCCCPSHPIAAGIPNHFELEKEETYGEFFDIPKPDDIIFLGWFDSGEVCRSGCTWTRGYGKIFFFQPGHETNHSFYQPNVRKIIQNACKWATPTIKVEREFKSSEIKTSLEAIRKAKI